MPRINIEDRIWSDSRFQDLILIVNNRFIAKGMIIELWTIAQKHWLENKSLIPKQEFERAGLSPLLVVGLAEERQDGIYAKGSEDHFAWYHNSIEQRKEAGKKSAEARRVKYGDAQPKNTIERDRTTLERDRTAVRTKPNDAEPSSSSSASFSKNLNTEETKGTALASVAPSSISSVSVKNSKPPSREVSSLVAAYVKAFQARYGSTVRPDVSPKVVGQMKRLLEYTPLERASALVQVYCQMRDPWFEKKAHDFSTFAENLSKIGLALDRGEESTGINWDKLERELEQDVLL